MNKPLKQFTIKKLKEPPEKNLDSDIEWVSNSLGFITPRDQDRTAFKILKALISEAKDGKGLTSEELTKLVEPTIGSVIYHLKRLMKAGLVVKLNSNYELRMNSLYSTIEETEKEIEIAIENVKKIASEIDAEVGLEHR